MATTVQKTIRYNFDEDIYFINNTYTKGKAAYNVAFGEYGGGSEKYNAYLIFRGVVIPKGATITNAYFEGCSDGYSSSATHVKISAEKNATVSMPTTKAAYDALVTTAEITWDITTEWNSLSWNSSSNIASCIQELVNLASWNSAGNDINILIKDNNSTSGYRAFLSDTSLMPKLVVTYTEEVAPVTLNASASIVCNSTIGGTVVTIQSCSVYISSSATVVAASIVDDMTVGLYSDIENATYSSLELLTYSEIENFKLSIPVYCSVGITSESSVVGNCRKIIVGVIALTAGASLNAIPECKKMASADLSATASVTSTCFKVFRLSAGITATSVNNATAIKIGFSQANVVVTSSGSFTPIKIVKVLVSTAITSISSVYGALTSRLFPAINVACNSSLSAIATMALIQDFHTFYVNITTNVTNYLGIRKDSTDSIEIKTVSDNKLKINNSSLEVVGVDRIDDITIKIHKINEVTV